MSLAQECMTRFQQKKLKDLGELEQDMATGLGNDGKAVNQKLVLQSLNTMCVSPVVGALERLRLVMIYLCSMGNMDPAVRRDLLAGISPSLQRSIGHLEKLGVDVNASTQKSKHSKERMAEFALRNKTIPLALMRYLPSLHGIMEQQVTYALDEDNFPYVTPPPEDQRQSMQAKPGAGRSARRKAGTSTTTSATGGNDWKRGEEKDGGGADRRPRFLIFVVGGVTFSEMRSCYEIAELHKANVYIGSSNTLNANEYIYELSGLKRDEFKQGLEQSLRPGEKLPEEFVGHDKEDDPSVDAAQIRVTIAK